MSRESRAIVRVSSLLAIEPFQSAEETRYYLHGANIEAHPDGGALLVATDGHTLGMVYDKNGHVNGLPQIWNHRAKVRLAKSAATWKKEWKTLKEHDVWAVLRHMPGEKPITQLVAATSAAEILDNQGTSVACFTDTNHETVIDGSFPDYWRSIPTRMIGKSEWVTPCAQPAYWKRLAEFATAIGAPSFRAYAADEGAAFRVSFPPNHETQVYGHAIVMPIRDGLGGEFEEPLWMDIARSPSKAEVVDLKKKAA